MAAGRFWQWVCSHSKVSAALGQQACSKTMDTPGDTPRAGCETRKLCTHLFLSYKKGFQTHSLEPGTSSRATLSSVSRQWKEIVFAGKMPAPHTSPPTAGQQPPRSRLPVGLRWSHTAISAHTLWLETLSERKPGAMLCLSQFSGKAWDTLDEGTHRELGKA